MRSLVGTGAREVGGAAHLLGNNVSAFLIFLAAAARAGIIATNILQIASYFLTTILTELPFNPGAEAASVIRVIRPLAPVALIIAKQRPW